MATDPTSILSSVLSKLPKDLQVQNANLGLARQQMTLAMKGGPAPHQSPGILSRVLDVLSRPNYAMAGMFGHTYDEIAQHGGHLSPGQQVASMGSGLLRGLEGKDKYRFSDVMQKAVEAHAPGSSLEKNRVVRGVGGLVSDIVTDPTTYAGVGFTKAVPAVESGVEALRAGQEAAAAIPKGAALADESINSVAQAGREAAAKAATPGSIHFELAGRPIGEGSPIAQGLYKGASSALRPVAESQVGQMMGGLFNTATQYPGKVIDYLRGARQAGISGWHDASKQILSDIGHLDRPEGAHVADNVMRGVDLTGQLAEKGEGPLKDLGAVQQYWSHLKNHFEATEAGLGIDKFGGLNRMGSGIDNFIPYYFRNPAEASKFVESDLAKSARSAIQKAREIGSTGAALPTFNDLKDAGFHPTTNLVDIARLRSAQHYRDVAMADFTKNLIDNFGTEISGKGTSTFEAAAHDLGAAKVPGKYLTHPDFLDEAGKTKNMFVTQQAADSLKAAHEFYNSDEATKRLWNTIDGVNRIWKTGVTSMNPGHHVHSMVGGIFLNHLAGVDNPVEYARGLRVLNGKGALKLGDLTVDAEDVKSLYKSWGAQSSFYNTELMGGPGEINTVMNRIGSRTNKVLEASRTLTSKEQDFIRVTNFVHQLRDYAAREGIHNYADLEKAAEEAATKVRHYNIDFGDVTPFESRLRRTIPFYTFTRKSIPLVAEAALTHPNRLNVVPKGLNALQQLLGTDSEHMSMDHVIPQYLKDEGAIPIMGGAEPTFANLMPPSLRSVGDTFNGSGRDVMRKAFGQLNPILRMPMELGFGHKAFSGQPVGSTGRYLAEQNPVSRLIYDKLKPQQPNRVILPGEASANQSQRIGLLNELLGGGLKQITPQVELSEIKRVQQPVQAKLKTLRVRAINKALGTG